MDKKALICENSLTAAHSIKRMLEKFGYNVKIAETAGKTLDLLKQNKYDLLTLDVLLPDKNGIEIIKEIQNIELAKALPIIIISATKEEENHIDFDHNIICWIEKSFDMSSFENAIKQVSNQNNKHKADILYVEDDNDLLNLMEITLQDIANVTKVDNLEQAIEFVEKNQFDLIVLDYLFPSGTAEKIIPLIKSGINKDAKIVLFSAYDENRDIAKYMDEIIIKSNISFDEFKDTIEKLI